MRTATPRFSKIVTVLQITGILLFGLLVGGVATYATNKMYRQSFLSRVQTAALSIRPAQLQALQTNDDEANNDYVAIKQQLLDLHTANSDAKFIYLMGQREEGEIFFFADSELASSEDYSPPGQSFEEASTELKDIFTNQLGLVEGPISDRWGVWLSALVPIIDPVTHQVVAVLGMDIPAAEYLSFAGSIGLLPFAGAAMVAVGVSSARSSRRKREEVIELKARLASTISHDLRSPLAGIRLATERLAQGKQDTEHVVSISKQIAQSVHELEESVTEVFDLSRMDTEAGRLTMDSVDLTPVLDDVFAVQKFSAESKEMHVVRAPEWPASLMVVCDRVKMKQVFSNLVSNAIKYGKPGTEVRVDYTRTPSGHTITVTDHGIGIPVAEQQKVLAGYYRASNARQTNNSGSGLGLYLVATTVRQHGGTLHIDSEQDKGTAISLFLPDK